MEVCHGRFSFQKTFYTEKLKRDGDRETELGVCNLRLYILTMSVEIDAEGDRGICFRKPKYKLVMAEKKRGEKATQRWECVTENSYIKPLS